MEQRSINKTQNMDWNTQIRGALGKNYSIVRNDTLVLDSVPEYMIKDGISDIPLAVPLNVITKAQSGRDAYHSIKDSKLTKLQEGIRNPRFVIDNPGRNSLIFVTNIKQAGLPVIVSFEKNTNFDGDDVHKATSIHLREDVGTLFNDLSPDAKIYFANKNELNETVGVANNLRSLADNIKFIDEIIPQKEETVNNKDYVNSGSKALMTQDRIDYLIEESGAGNRQDYAKEWITSISPTDFINLTTDAETQNRNVFDNLGSEWDSSTNMNNYNYLDQLGKSVRQTPYIAINTRGDVVGHDGRHRIRALEKEGINSVEIVVEIRNDDGSVLKYEPSGKRWVTLKNKKKKAKQPRPESNPPVSVVQLFLAKIYHKHRLLSMTKILLAGALMKWRRKLKEKRKKRRSD